MPPIGKQRPRIGYTVTNELEEMVKLVAQMDIYYEIWILVCKE